MSDTQGNVRELHALLRTPTYHHSALPDPARCFPPSCVCIRAAAGSNGSTSDDSIDADIAAASPDGDPLQLHFTEDCPDRGEV